MLYTGHLKSPLLPRMKLLIGTGILEVPNWLWDLAPLDDIFKGLYHDYTHIVTESCEPTVRVFLGAAVDRLFVKITLGR